MFGRVVEVTHQFRLRLRLHVRDVVNDMTGKLRPDTIGSGYSPFVAASLNDSTPAGSPIRFIKVTARRTRVNLHADRAVCKCYPKMTGPKKNARDSLIHFPDSNSFFMSSTIFPLGAGIWNWKALLSLVPPMSKIWPSSVKLSWETDQMDPVSYRRIKPQRVRIRRTMGSRDRHRRRDEPGCSLRE
jgi:hypothetical protein